MKKLEEADIIRIMQEEWNAKISRVLIESDETVDLDLKKVGKDNKVLLSPELKVIHKKSGLMYTIDSVGVNDLILRTPEGENFLVDATTLESEYELK